MSRDLQEVDVRKIFDALLEAGYRGVKTAGDFLMNKSLQVTPMNYGDLRRSKIVKEVKKGQVVLGYRAVYAHKVHESKGTLRGRPRPRGRGRYWDGGKPKWFKETIDKYGKPVFIKSVKDAINKELEGLKHDYSN